MGPVAGLILVAVAAAAAAVVVHVARGHGAGRHVAGGTLIGDAGAYDLYSGLLFGSLFRGIAADIADAASPRARVLEVGCGPGHLSVRLARDHDLDVTGLDLDPAMIARARANAERIDVAGRRPTVIDGDVASLPFDDASFDLVVSTFSMHHWSDPQAGLREIARVLKPGGRAIVWDLRPGVVPFHAHAPDPVEQVQCGPLRIVSVRPWRWPWRLAPSQRLELARD